jgi:hypothetical protein
MPLGSGSRQQQFAPAPGNSSFTIAASSTSSCIALGSFGFPYSDIEITNDSSSIDAWVTIGDSSSVTATIPAVGTPPASTPGNGYIVKPGQSKVITIGVAQPVYLAAITSTSTANLFITQGAGA